MFGWGSKPKPVEETTPDMDLSGSSDSSFSASDSSFRDVTESSYPSTAGVGADKDLQRAILLEQQRAQFQSQVHKLTEICWDTCVDKVGSYSDSRTETCITNCVDRFIDVTLAMTSRFAQMLQGQRGGY